MSFLEDLAQLREQRLEFGAGISDVFGVDQLGMASGLAQTQQGFQNLDL